MGGPEVRLKTPGPWSKVAPISVSYLLSRNLIARHVPKTLWGLADP